jgi:hypothetical protein
MVIPLHRVGSELAAARAGRDELQPLLKLWRTGRFVLGEMSPAAGQYRNAKKLRRQVGASSERRPPNAERGTRNLSVA